MLQNIFSPYFSTHACKNQHFPKTTIFPETTNRIVLFIIFSNSLCSYSFIFLLQSHFIYLLQPDLIVTAQPTPPSFPTTTTTTSAPPVVSTGLPVSSRPTSLNHTITHGASTGIRLEPVDRVLVPIPSARDGCRADDQVRCSDGSEIYIWLNLLEIYLILFLPNKVLFYMFTFWFFFILFLAFLHFIRSTASTLLLLLLQKYLLLLCSIVPMKFAMG